MTAVILEPTERWWRCPSCELTDRTFRGDVHTQMHHCPAMNGMALPLQEVPRYDAKPDARHVLVEREDYAGSPDADRIAAIYTERGDGSNDCTVLAPTAVMKIQ